MYYLGGNSMEVYSFKTVNGKEACTTAGFNISDGSFLVSFKTVNGKEACTTCGGV